MAFGFEAYARNNAPSSRYMGGPAELVTAPNGAIVNKELLETLPKVSWPDGPEIENPVEGVYVLGGYLTFLPHHLAKHQTYYHALKPEGQIASISQDRHFKDMETLDNGKVSQDPRPGTYQGRC